MSEQQYVWMLGVISAWRQMQQRESDLDEPFPSAMEEVTAVAGRLRAPEKQAANDMAAVMFILLLLLLWSCAKHCAFFGGFHSKLCKINEAAIFSLIARIPHEISASGIPPAALPCDKSITSPHWT